MIREGTLELSPAEVFQLVWASEWLVWIRTESPILRHAVPAVRSDLQNRCKRQHDVSCCLSLREAAEAMRHIINDYFMEKAMSHITATELKRLQPGIETVLEDVSNNKEGIVTLATLLMHVLELIGDMSLIHAAGMVAMWNKCVHLCQRHKIDICTMHRELQNCEQAQFGQLQVGDRIVMDRLIWTLTQVRQRLATTDYIMSCGSRYQIGSTDFTAAVTVIRNSATVNGIRA